MKKVACICLSLMLSFSSLIASSAFKKQMFNKTGSSLNMQVQEIKIDENLEQIKNLYEQDSKDRNFEKDFIKCDGIYIHKNVDIGKFADKIRQNMKKAKHLLKDNLDLNFNENLPIIVVAEKDSKEICWDMSESVPAYYTPTQKFILIKDTSFNEGSFAYETKPFEILAHEMTHAQLHYELGDKYIDLKDWLNEGLATQNNKNNYLGVDLKMCSEDDFFCWAEKPTANLSVDEQHLGRLYILNQVLIKKWIENQGKGIVWDLINYIKKDKESKSYLDGFKKENDVCKNFFFNNGGQEIYQEMLQELYTYEKHAA